MINADTAGTEDKGFGDLSSLIMLGGGPLLPQIAKKARERGASVLAVISERHSNDIIDLGKGPIALGRYLERNGIEFIVSQDVNRDAEVIGRIAGEALGISFGAAWIFKQDFIDLFGGRLINLHGTRLPEDKGGGGFSWRIMRDDRKGYVLIHQVAPGIDEGDIITFEEFLYPHGCRIPAEYERYTIDKYLDLFEAFFKDIQNGRSFKLIPQQGYFSSYWPRLQSDVHGYIDWQWSVEEIERFICAFDDPYPGASTYLNERRVRLKKCVVDRGAGSFHPFQRGIVYRVTEEAVYIASREGALIVSSVVDEAGVKMQGSLRVGDRFHTPISYLEKALEYRAIYTPEGLKGN
jgi:methionyl-tRNA formyltransferase